jgi:hypothetical protein
LFFLKKQNVFVEPLADAHTEITTAFDVCIADKRWNAIFAGGGAGAVAPNAAATLAQTLKIEDDLAVVMKDCNFHLTYALCQALNTPQMTAHQYLTNLDFVTDASGCRTNFGRIPQADVRFPHVYLFSKLLMEYFKSWPPPWFFK